MVPRAFDLEVRSYFLDRESQFQLRAEDLTRLVDRNTKLLLVNTPHNPTGAAIDNRTLEVLHDFAQERGIQFVCDEVHRPIFQGEVTRSAAQLPCATTIGDFSKAFSMPGLRLGWIIEPDARRRSAYRNMREYVTICNSPITEFVAEIAARHSRIIYDRAAVITARNLALLDEALSQVSEAVQWVKPTAGMTGFPWLNSGGSARALCLAAAKQGILLIPGDCMGAPEHFRLGFGSQEFCFEEACSALAEFLRSWSRQGRP